MNHLEDRIVDQRILSSYLQIEFQWDGLMDPYIIYNKQARGFDLEER